MYRRLAASLPPDPVYPADFKSLGYFINDKDQIRMISDPNQPFNYWFSRNMRHVEMQKEAMSEAVRRHVLDRLTTDHDMTIRRLPLGASPSEPHVPILASSNISIASRILVYVGESGQDLAIFAGRLLSQQSIARGSAIEFVANARRSDPDLAVVLANPGQLLWYRRGGRAMSSASWRAIPRKTAVSPGLRQTEQNVVKGHEDAGKHVKSVFEAVRALARSDAKVDIIGVADGATEVLDFLQESLGEWREQLEAVVLCGGYLLSPSFEEASAELEDFWSKRVVMYLVCQEAINTPLYGRDKMGCNVYSSGEPSFIECIIPRAQRTILNYFKLVSRSTDYAEVPQDIAEPGRVDEGNTWDEDAELPGTGQGKTLETVLEDMANGTNGVKRANGQDDEGSD